jgi:malic enzyme
MLLQRQVSLCHAQHIFMMDSKGLITTHRGDKLPHHKQLMAREDTPNLKELKDVIAYVKPHALIGLTGAGPSFKKVQGHCNCYCCACLVLCLARWSEW